MMKRLLFVFLVMVMLFACLTVANAANSYRLVLPSTKIPAQLSERKLSDDEVAQLLNADLQTMRERISTYADYIALVECNEAFYYESLVSDDKESVDIGGEYTRAWMGNMFAPNMSAGLAYYVLQDDYPGMKVVVAYYMQGDAGSAAQLRYGSVIPVEDGYIVLSAESFAKNAQENAGVAAKAIQTAHVQELGGIVDLIREEHCVKQALGDLKQVLLIDTLDTVRLTMDRKTKMYTPSDMEHTEILYESADARVVKKGEPKTLAQYGVSITEPEPTITSVEEAAAIHQLPLSEAAERINTLHDCMNYFYFNSYAGDGGDLQLPVRNDLAWHYNYAPAVVYEKNCGCCGETAGLVAELLKGDYEEVGIVGMTYAEGCGGGHVINYIKNDEAYYVFDLYSWACNDFTGAGLGCSRDSDLNKATIGWSYNLGMQDTIKCMYTYTNPRSGDAPVGWSNVDWGVSYLIKDYAEDVNIVLETPDEGYVYEFVDVNENVYNAIEYSRRAW